MKHRAKTLVTALIAVAALASLAAGSASALPAHQWLKNNKIIESPLAATATGTLTFEQGGISGPTELLCSVKETMTVGPGAASSVSAITSPTGATTIPCTFGSPFGVCFKKPTITAVTPPWGSELVTLSEKLRNTFSGGKNHNWIFQCEGLGLDECQAAPTATVKNVAGGTVQLVYESNYPGNLFCAALGKEIWSGTLVVKAVAPETTISVE